MKLIPISGPRVLHSERLVFSSTDISAEGRILMDKYKKAMDEFQVENPHCTARECRRAAEKVVGQKIMIVSQAEKIKKGL